MSWRRERLLHAPNEYFNDGVLTAGWDIKRQAQPKDNDPYHPPGGNYFLSTYNCIGDHVTKTPARTETHDMLRQIYTHRITEHAWIDKPVSWTAAIPKVRQSQPYVAQLSIMQRDYQPYSQTTIKTSRGFDLRESK